MSITRLSCSNGTYIEFVIKQLFVRNGHIEFINEGIEILGNHNLILRADERGIEKLSDHTRSGKSVLVSKRDIVAYLDEINTGKVVSIDPHFSPAGNSSVFIGAVFVRTMPGRIRNIDNSNIQLIIRKKEEKQI